MQTNKLILQGWSATTKITGGSFITFTVMNKYSGQGQSINVPLARFPHVLVTRKQGKKSILALPEHAIITMRISYGIWSQSITLTTQVNDVRAFNVDFNCVTYEFDVYSYEDESHGAASDVVSSDVTNDISEDEDETVEIEEEVNDDD